MSTPRDKKPESTGDQPAESAESRPRQPSPSERHPGLKPEEADSDFEDLQIRDSENRR